MSRERSHYDSDDLARYYRRDEGLYDKEVAAFEFIPPGSKILDLGCGAGRTTGPLARNSRAVFGLDIAFAMVRAARERVSGVPFLVGDACALCFRNDEFDVVVIACGAQDSIFPLERRRRVLAEVGRVLKPGGLFILSAHNNCIPRDSARLLPFLRSLVRRDRSGYFLCDARSPQEFRIYLGTPAAQVNELTRFGFEPLSIVPRRALRRIGSLGLIGLVDPWVYYVCRNAAPGDEVGDRVTREATWRRIGRTPNWTPEAE